MDSSRQRIAPAPLKRLLAPPPNWIIFTKKSTAYTSAFDWNPFRTLARNGKNAHSFAILKTILEKVPFKKPTSDRVFGEISATPNGIWEIVPRRKDGGERRPSHWPVRHHVTKQNSTATTHKSHSNSWITEKKTHCKQEAIKKMQFSFLLTYLSPFSALKIKIKHSFLRHFSEAPKERNELKTEAGVSKRSYVKFENGGINRHFRREEKFQKKQP